jgi:hypothetical protein
MADVLTGPRPVNFMPVIPSTSCGGIRPRRMEKGLELACEKSQRRLKLERLGRLRVDYQLKLRRY